MPNHITNVVTIHAPEGRTYQEVLNHLKSVERDVDFNTLVPMPKAIEASYGESGLRPAWYQWSLDNWGTKWNAYDIYITENVIRFDTAWSAPGPIFQALYNRFPDYTFDIKYADEDLGYNFGHLIISPEGEMSRRMPESGTAEARIWVCSNVKDEWPEYMDKHGNFIED
ncbi:hypothetical protein P4H71_04260 [Paenibacillus kribbensis]|uniref:DUF1281 family ferredoxin-like fold protein n=1 Tax=Paenibacillus kribbensis TaxID=172713 RepID=UPI002DB850C5|nr:hypothetical protein [Paenibacillus kribbensis]MEC0233568.1 hypothetical protein [Paenibacillus kribbensis]